MADFEIVQGATSPPLVADLAYVSGSPINLLLPGTVVKFVLRDPAAAAPFIDTTVTISSATEVTYVWQPGDTATAGLFLGTFDITFPDGSKPSNVAYFSVAIRSGSPSVYAPPGDAATVGDLIAAVRRRIGGRPSKQNVLFDDLDANPATIQLVTKYPSTMINVGSTLMLGTETLYVWEKDNDGRTLTVQRGYAGSSPTAHTAGTLILVDPVFTDADIFAELNAELASLPSQGLYRVATTDLIASPILTGYPLPADMIGADVLDVSWLMKSSILYRPQIDDYRVEVNVPTDEFPTGNALFLYRRPLPGQPFRITYKAAFNPVMFVGDVITTTTGLPGSAVDVLELGAALRVTYGLAIGRADYTRQGDSRRAGEVRTQEVLAAPGDLRAKYAQRLADEVSRLDGLYSLKLVRRSIW